MKSESQIYWDSNERIIKGFVDQEGATLAKYNTFSLLKVLLSINTGDRFLDLHDKCHSFTKKICPSEGTGFTVPIMSKVKEAGY